MNIINEEKKDKILNISFNQDNSLLSVSTENGFFIYGTQPLKKKQERRMDGGIGNCEMLYRTNLLALIGGGELPKYNPSKLIIWDDKQNNVISEIKFFSNIKNVKLKKNKIFCILENNIYVFDLDTLENTEIIPTRLNPKGLFGINNNEDKTVIAYLPKLNDKNILKGSIIIKNYDKGKAREINAHDDLISCISLNNDGTLLATSNEKGIIIRIHSCLNGDLLSQFKRGMEKVEINYICFDNLNNYLAATSDKGTIHIWSLNKVVENLKNIRKNGNTLGVGKNAINNNENFIKSQNDKDNNNNKLCEIIDDEQETIEINNLPINKKTILGKAEKSFARIKLTSNSICSFQKDNIIFVATYDGMYYKALLDTKNGGHCKIILQDYLSNLKK
jgi:WD40 repeat protein